MRIDVHDFDQVHRLSIGPAVVHVAVHRAVHGRAFGGIRVCQYSSDEDALQDACRLALAMSRKVISSGLPAGGAKTVVRVPEGGWSDDQRRRVLAAVGAFVEQLGGLYHCGADLGFTDADEQAVRSETAYVAPRDLGPWTARTVLLAMRAFGEPRSVAVQGVGSVGSTVARELVEAGARVVVADPNTAAVAALQGVDVVDPEQIYDVECDVFSPCAGGGVLTAERVKRLRCEMVCGGANNPLAEPAVAEALRERGIRYVPDVIANAGAVMKGAADALGRSGDVEGLLALVPERARSIVLDAESAGRSPHDVANERADALMILALER